MSSGLLTTLEPAPAPVTVVDAPALAPRCGDCGSVLYSGLCLAVGYCASADASATRGAARTSAKYRPAAWTVSGGVD